MRTITLIASGTRGDIQPYLALGLGLQHAGFTINIATHLAFQPLVTEAGLTFKAIEPNPTALMFHAGDQMALTFEGSWLSAIRSTRRYIKRTRARYGELLDSALDACVGSDFIIAGLPTLWAKHIAEITASRLIWAFLQPISPTRAFASPMLGLVQNTANKFPIAFARLSYQLVAQAMWQPWRSCINQWRIAHRLQAAPFWGEGKNELTIANQLTLHGFSSHIVPKPSDWGQNHYITGYWLMPSFNYDPVIASFIQRHKHVIYVGFGSMIPVSLQTMFRMVATIAEKFDCGVIMLVPQNASLPPHPLVLTMTQVSHQWLFPQMSAIVHHGGAGTTAAALSSGVPSFITPISADQFFWANRLYALKISPKPLALSQITETELENAISQCINSSELKIRTCEMAKKINTENGVDVAVSLITKHVRRAS
jgi:sterol 3beta-glucosyltransferase